MRLQPLFSLWENMSQKKIHDIDEEEFTSVKEHIEHYINSADISEQEQIKERAQIIEALRKHRILFVTMLREIPEDLFKLPLTTNSVMIACVLLSKANFSNILMSTNGRLEMDKGTLEEVMTRLEKDEQIVLAKRILDNNITFIGDMSEYIEDNIEIGLRTGLYKIASYKSVRNGIKEIVIKKGLDYAKEYLGYIDDEENKIELKELAEKISEFYEE